MSVQFSSDFAITRTITTQIKSTQNEIFKLQRRSNSDFKNENYYEMDSTLANQSIYVEDLLRKKSLEVKSCEWSQSLIYMQEGSLKRLFDVVESGKKLIAQGYNDLGPIGAPDMTINSKSMLSRIEDELLTEYFGMNIWNGSRTNEPPFKENDLVNGRAGDNYYKGDDFTLQFYFDHGSVEFGDRANLQCFRDLIQALQIMRDSQNPTTRAISKTDLQNASTLLDQAQLGITSLLQALGNVEQTIMTTKTNAEQSINNLSEIYTNNLNGMSEEDRAMNLVDAAAVQRKLGYILPIAMKYLKEMNIVQYL